MEITAYAVYDLILKASIVLDDGDHQVLAAFDLNPTQYAALQLLDQQEGRRLVDLAERLLCERSTVTRVIDRLELGGFVQRANDADDRRSQRVVLTEAGTVLRQRSRAAHQESVERRLAGLSQGEQKQLGQALEKLLSELTSQVN